MKFIVNMNGQFRLILDGWWVAEKRPWVSNIIVQLLLFSLIECTIKSIIHKVNLVTLVTIAFWPKCLSLLAISSVFTWYIFNIQRWTFIILDEEPETSCKMSFPSKSDVLEKFCSEKSSFMPSSLNAQFEFGLI